MPQQSSPLLDDYNKTGVITPALQRALDSVRQKLPQFQGLQAPTTPAAPGTTGTPKLLPPSAPIPSIARNVTPPATTSTPAPVAAAPTTPTPMITTPDAAAHQAERDRLIKTGSGISQVHNPIARGLLRAADIAGSAFFPNITRQIPGTELHHEGLVKRSEGYVNQDVARAKENATTAETETRTANEVAAAPGQRAHTEAQTAEANARTGAIPAETALREAQTAEAQARTQDIETGKQQENTHVLPDGTVIAVHNDPKTGKSTAEVLYQGKPAEKPGHVIQRLVNGKLHNILVDAETGKDRADLGEGRQPTPADHGTTVIGPDGKVLRLEPGQTAPPGFTTPQQGGAANAAEAKAFKSANDAVKYGQDYIKSGQFTGPKDEALLEAFFEVAKPSSGFRMTQPQIDMLMNARSWIQTAEGIAYHAKTGTWFAPDQRQKIVEAMEARAASKGAHEIAPTIIRARDPQGKLHEAPAGTPLPAGWKVEK